MDVSHIAGEEQNEFCDDSIATDDDKNGNKSDAGEQVFQTLTNIDKERKMEMNQTVSMNVRCKFFEVHNQGT